MVNAIGDTSESMDIMRRQTLMTAQTQIYGVDTSLTPSECIGGTPGVIEIMKTQQSMSATNQIYGAVPSYFVDFNVQMDQNESRFYVDGLIFFGNVLSCRIGLGASMGFNGSKHIYRVKPLSFVPSCTFSESLRALLTPTHFGSYNKKSRSPTSFSIFR
ncbi:hypothetical protein LOK49_LG07G00339 [Camellia lanceoleosa]|uniref:Uncharacterized protein n=1 Tax=Camellia lanceoleosa TaxID=1840588 RepID=A0ACC0GZV8_9ERIC|nr:hypothetical protein LOK49_LG07G00339 [Camellia lanceoleosa]